MTDSADYAIYSEYSHGTSAMALDEPPEAVDGWNVRRFNTVEVQQGERIRLDQETGTVLLAPGTYHVSATSIVDYDPGTATGDARASLKTGGRAIAGYCRLRYRDTPAGCADDEAIAVGTVNYANWAVPSLVETYLTLAEETGIILEHQAGRESPNDVYLQIYSSDSPWHVFARISIRRL